MPGRLRTGCDFYPRPPRGGRPPYLTAICSGIMISIHALREEGDCSSWASTRNRENFYPRPPRGGRPAAPSRTRLPVKFLSTPSARRATLRSAASAWYHEDFYPRPPRGGRRGRAFFRNRMCRFLSTPSARRATGDHVIPDFNFALFLSTPSARRATQHDFHVWRIHDISIHALREEGDGLRKSSDTP